MVIRRLILIVLDCKTVGFFFSQNRFSVAKESHTCEERKTHTVSPQSCSPFSALHQTFCLTACAYLNTQKYGLFCSLWSYGNLEMLVSAEKGDRSTWGKTFLNKERTNIKLNHLWSRFWNQQRKCKAGGLFLAFHLQLTWKKTQIFSSAKEANLFVRANCHESIWVFDQT